MSVSGDVGEGKMMCTGDLLGVECPAGDRETALDRPVDGGSAVLWTVGSLRDAGVHTSISMSGVCGTSLSAPLPLEGAHGGGPEGQLVTWTCGNSY